MTEPNPTPALDDADFDHLEEAKATLAYIDRTVSHLDITQSIAVATANVLVSIAQSLEALAFADAEYELTDLGVGVGVVATPLPPYAGANYFTPEA